MATTQNTLDSVFTEEQIQARMAENDYDHYLTMDADSGDVEDEDIISWMNETGSGYIQEQAQAFLDYKIDGLRTEAIAELEEEATPDSIKRQRRIDSIKANIARLNEELEDLTIAAEELASQTIVEDEQ
jgi:hypothetical protein